MLDRGLGLTVSVAVGERGGVQGARRVPRNFALQQMDLIAIVVNSERSAGEHAQTSMALPFVQTKLPPPASP